MRGLLLLLLLAAAGAATLILGRGARPLPDTLVVEEIVAHLSDALPAEAVLEQRADDAVREGRLEPGDRLRAGGHRPTLVLPPPARVRFRLTLPPDAALRFAVGVEGARERDPSLGGVRFSVTVDGRERWSRERQSRRAPGTIAAGSTSSVSLGRRGRRRWRSSLATAAADPARPPRGHAGVGAASGSCATRDASRACPAPSRPERARPPGRHAARRSARHRRRRARARARRSTVWPRGGRVFEQAVAQSSLDAAVGRVAA